MKRLLWVLLAILVVTVIIFTGCGEKSTSTTAQTSSPAATTSTQAPASTTSKPASTTAGGAQYGGTVRVINAQGPAIMGYSLEQGPGDLFVLLCAVEKLLEYNEKQELVPNLAESFKVDDAAKTITVKMRQGIKFHDGSDCDADAIAWNFEQQVANKRIGYLDQWVKLSVVDKLTFVIQYSGTYNNQLINGWLWSPPMYSKMAFINAGNGDIEKSKDWARLNVSGTGPFKQGEFIRDVSLTMVRNENYWGGKPYLDAIKYIFIPDPVTAALKLEAKEAEMWFSVSIKNQIDLEKKGLKRLAGQPSVMQLYPNLKKADSKWQNKDLREAVEYAIDKAGIAAAMGFGLYKEAKMVVPEGAWGFDAGYAGRTYDPDKAKQLVEKSGFKGSTIKLLVLTGSNADTATAVKRYLDDAGLKCEVDIADPGRFYGSYYGTGWDDLLLSTFGVMGNSLTSFHMNLGDQPLTKMGSWILPESLVAISKESRTLPTEEAQKEAAGKLYKGLSDNAYLIPIYGFKSANMIQPYFHTTIGQESGFSQYWGRYWMEQK